MLCFTPGSALRFGLHGALWGRGGLSPGGGIGCELFSEEALGARWGYQRVSLLLQPLGLSSMVHASADISLSGEDVRVGAQRAQYELGISCAKLPEVASSVMPLMATPTLPCPASRSMSSADGGCIEFRILLRCLRNLS